MLFSIGILMMFIALVMDHVSKSDRSLIVANTLAWAGLVFVMISVIVYGWFTML